MPLSLTSFLQTDDLTILLALIAATIFLVSNLYKSQPLVHPILLGRQSDVGRSRKPGESAVYRNYNTGLMGRFPVRPSKEVHVLGDLLRLEVESPRTLWATRLTNGALQDRVAAFGTGLIHAAHLQPQKSTVFLLLNDCLEFIIADLALASHSILSLTLTSSSLLAPIFDAYPQSAIICHAFLLPRVLKIIYDSNSGHQKAEHTIIVLGEPTAQMMASVASNIKVYRFDELEREGMKREKVLSPIPKPSDIFTISVFESSSSSQIQGVHLTHENVTAGVAAIRGIFPPSNALNALDTISSVHSLSGAYGRAVAYTAVHEGTSFATIPGSEVFPDGNDEKLIGADALTTKRYPIPAPTILFVQPGLILELTERILEEAKKSWVYAVAWRHKFAGVMDGFVTNQSPWDRLVFDEARAKVLGDEAGALRAVVTSGGVLQADALTPSRIALSVPFTNAFTHPISTAPILASHPLDLQDFSADASLGQQVAHCGAPGVNVEVKLLGVDDEAVENRQDPRGSLVVRGPPVGKVVSLSVGEVGEDYVEVGSGSGSPGSNTSVGTTEGVHDADWVKTGVEARVLTNGAFMLVRKTT